MAVGRLYVVATPIGNLGDLSPRAAATLADVEVIACEDTRVTRKLTSSGGIKTKLISYREDNAGRVGPRLIEMLLAGTEVALVSDAGTPCLSDPGHRLVRDAAEAGVEVVAIPGPTALTALLSVCGLPTDRFVFEGFLPARGAARARAIAKLSRSQCTVVVYESPRRVVSLLSEIARVCDDPLVAVGRELTKLHEEVLRGRASQLAEQVASKGPRGEFAVAVAMSAGEGPVLTGPALAAEVARLVGEGLSVRDVATRLKQEGVSRRAVYEAARQLKR